MNFAAVAVAVLSCLALCTIVNATKKSRVCGTKHWPQCALEQANIATDDFAILPTRLSSAEDEDISFSVRVYRTGCPTINTQGLQWYKLEAFAAGTNTSIGAFVEPIQSRRLETYSCHDESTIVFDTCEPHPMDLPRQYMWHIPNVNISVGDQVCFSLTILDTDDQCKYTESCVAMQSESSSGDSESETAALRQHVGSGAYGESPNITERCYQRWDCTEAKLRFFCGSDGNTYMSRCHIRLQECLTDTDISIQHAGQCGANEQPEACHIQRDTLKKVFDDVDESFNYWLPTCDCDGLFKPIQCDEDSMNPGQLECWCSYSNSISAVAGTRQKLIDSCTDPATFTFSCSLT